MVKLRFNYETDVYVPPGVSFAVEIDFPGKAELSKKEILDVANLIAKSKVVKDYFETDGQGNTYGLTWVDVTATKQIVLTD